MLDRAAALDMAKDRDVVGRVDEDHLRPRPIHQLGDRGVVSGIGADQPVATEEPEIALFDSRVAHCWHLIVGFSLIIEIGRQSIDLCRIEAGQGDIQPLGVEETGQLTKFDREQVPIPAGILGDLVIGQRERPPPRRAQSSDAKGRDFLKPNCSMLRAIWAT